MPTYSPWSGNSLDPQEKYKQAVQLSALGNPTVTDTSLWGKTKNLFGFNNQVSNYDGIRQSLAGTQFSSMSNDQLQYMIDNNILSFDSSGNLTNFAKDKNGGFNVGQLDTAATTGLTGFNNNRWTTQDTFGAIGTGINAVTGLYGMYNAQKQLGLAKQAFAEQTALNRANFKNQAKTLNSQYRDQMSGRGHIGMSSEGRTALGRAYAKRKLEESY